MLVSSLKSFESERGKNICVVFSEEDALEVINLLHQKGVATVILSSTELSSPTHLGKVG